MIIKLSILAVLLTLVTTSPLPMSELNKFIEGDMKLNVYQQSVLNGISPKTGLLEIIRRWDKNSEGFVIVAYILDPRYTQWHVDWMLDQFRQIESKTCVRFVNRTIEVDWLDIRPEGGCYSYVGRQGGRQEVGMVFGCFYWGVGAHEMMHALGFGHMHNADDRDEFIELRWDNMQHEDHRSFTKYSKEWFSNFGTSFDYMSSMNYDRSAYSINGKDVIVTRDPKYADLIGRQQFSIGDATRVNRMYQCNLP